MPALTAPVDPADLETLPPGTKLSDLAAFGAVDAGDLVTLPPGTKLSDLPGISPAATTPGLQLDLLLLTPEDLLVEEAAPVAPEAEPELDLEELDLETLRSLPLEGAAAVAAAAVAAASLPEPAPAAVPAFPVEPEAEPLDLTPDTGSFPPQGTEPTWEAFPEAPAAPGFPMDLPHPPPAAGGFEVVSGEVLGVPIEPEPAPAPEAAAVPAFALDAAPPSTELPPIQTMDLDADLLPPMEDGLEGWPPQAEPLPTSHPMAAALAAGPPSPVPRPSEAPAAAPPAPAELGPGPAADVLRAMMADPALMDALARAVVARLGDQALREIAWEVMPELAEKLHRPS